MWILDIIVFPADGQETCARLNAHAIGKELIVQSVRWHTSLMQFNCWSTCNIVYKPIRTMPCCFKYLHSAARMTDTDSIDSIDDILLSSICSASTVDRVNANHIRPRKSHVYTGVHVFRGWQALALIVTLRYMYSAFSLRISWHGRIRTAIACGNVCTYSIDHGTAICNMHQ